MLLPPSTWLPNQGAAIHVDPGPIVADPNLNTHNPARSLKSDVQPGDVDLLTLRVFGVSNVGGQPKVHLGPIYGKCLWNV